MKFEFRKSTLIKFALILVILALAPFALPFTLEFIIVADLMGLEALIVFLLSYAKSTLGSLRARTDEACRNVTRTLGLVAELYIFKPKVYIGHATVSSVVIICASSVLLACTVWLPVMLASAHLAGS